MVYKFNEMNNSQQTINLETINLELLSSMNILGFLYAVKTNNIDKKEVALNIFKEFESFLEASDKNITPFSIELLKHILETDIDINMDIGNTFTVTIICGFFLNFEILEFLLSNGANDLIKNKYNDCVWDIFEKENNKKDISEYLENYPISYRKYMKWKNTKKFNL